MGIDDLLTPKRAAILQIVERYGASNLRVFGSVARGEAGPNSDIDFLVTLAPGTGLAYMTLWEELEQVLDRKVDLLTEQALHWYIRERALQEAVTL
ncbi:MAG: nucleotidyltransferase family protein [Chloroflexota bacterium]|nr:nucleotidyltransferase family protein [Chloroflexota bacterium]